MRIHNKQKTQQHERRMRPSQSNDSSSARDSREKDSARKRNARSRTERIIVPRKSIFRFVPIILALSIITVSIFYVFTLSGDSQSRVQFVESFSLENTQARDYVWNADAYRAEADAVLSSSWLNRSKLTVRSELVARHIEATFPEVLHASLRISVVDDTPIIHIVPREPVILLETIDGSWYLIDEKGVSIAQVEKDARKYFESLVQAVDQVGLEATPGARVLPSDTVLFINNIIYQLDAANIDIERAFLPAAANELQIQPKNTSIVGKFDITREHRGQAGTFIATYEQLRTNDELPEEYIDARVEGRVYYR